MLIQQRVASRDIGLISQRYLLHQGLVKLSLIFQVAYKNVQANAMQHCNLGQNLRSTTPPLHHLTDPAPTALCPNQIRAFLFHIMQLYTSINGTLVVLRYPQNRGAVRSKYALQSSIARALPSPLHIYNHLSMSMIRQVTETSQVRM